MPSKTTKQQLYLIPLLTKALDILEFMQNKNQSMTLEFIHRQTRVSKSTAYRVLKTFVHRGYVSLSPDLQYRLVTRPKKLLFGFAGQSSEMPFSNEVTASLRKAAESAGVDLLLLDNKYDAATALKNAEEFVRSKVDLVIEFQVEQEVAPMISDLIAGANIPLIAIDIPHPHATYFGVDNYRVGVEAGEMLATYAVENWGGKVDWVLGLDLPEAGLLVQGRITGAVEGIRRIIPELRPESIRRFDSRGMRDRSKKVVSDFLIQHPKNKHILIATATDSSALGAVDAVREQKRRKHVVIVGQDCIAEAIEEMLKEDTPLIASVSHEISSYGPRLVDLGLSLLGGHTVPPYNYVEHKLVTRDSLHGVKQPVLPVTVESVATRGYLVR
jgi:ribose transport system substrate-binding protein